MSEQTAGQPANGGEWDPLIPESEQVTDSDAGNFMESDPAATSGPPDEAASESSAASASGTASPATGGQPDDMMMPEDNPRGSSGTAGQISDEIRAAQEALEKAGIALQTAGATLETATTDAELAEAESQLAKARLAVIVAGQDLTDIRDPGRNQGTGDMVNDAEEALNEANVAIVVATQKVFSSRLELPDFDPAKAGGAAATGRQGQLDRELDESIVVFEGKVLEAREDVLGSTPPPTGSGNVPGVAVLGGSQTGELGQQTGTGTFEENRDGDKVGVPDIVQQGNMPDDGEKIAKTKVEAEVSGTSGQPPIPDDIPDPQGDDIVAKQLREAAIAETDAALRKKLWDEYRKYRAGL